jgi:hypothetical protein
VVCRAADYQLEQAINARLERGSVSVWSEESPSFGTRFGLCFSWKGRNHLIEQDQPFDADEVVAKAQDWADRLENTGLKSPQTRTAALICEAASSNIGSVLPPAPDPDASIRLPWAERVLLLLHSQQRHMMLITLWAVLCMNAAPTCAYRK